MKRPKLSVDLFGKPTFYLGLAIGVGLTILGFVFLVYGFELQRNTTYFSGDFLRPTDEEMFVYNLFFAAISIACGFGGSVWFWLHNPFRFGIPRQWIQFMRLYALCGSLILMVIVVRSGSVLTILLYSMPGYDGELDFYHQLPLLLFLLPTVFFLNVWTVLRLKFRAGRWFWTSLAVFVGGSFLLVFAFQVDRSKIDGQWAKTNAPYDRIVNEEVTRARNHGIEISGKDIEVLRLNGRRRVLEMALVLKHRFGSRVPIQTADVVKELVLVRKTTFSSIGQDDNWPFPYPFIVYEQMKLSQDSLKFEYLREILEEYRVILNQTEEEQWNLTDQDGLYLKYGNRAYIQRRRPDLTQQVDVYLDSADLIKPRK